jgi:hypothetical protein
LNKESLNVFHDICHYGDTNQKAKMNILKDYQAGNTVELTTVWSAIP